MIINFSLSYAYVMLLPKALNPTGLNDYRPLFQFQFLLFQYLLYIYQLGFRPFHCLYSIALWISNIIIIFTASLFKYKFRKVKLKWHYFWRSQGISLIYKHYPGKRNSTFDRGTIVVYIMRARLRHYGIRVICCRINLFIHCIININFSKKPILNNIFFIIICRFWHIFSLWGNL